MLTYSFYMSPTQTIYPLRPQGVKRKGVGGSL